MHSEFERTPKAASVTGRRTGGQARYTVKVHWPYVLAEAFFVAYQLAWTALFLADGLILAALGTTYVGACVASLAYFYGDHAGQVCFVIDRARRHKGRPARLMQNSPGPISRRNDSTCGRDTRRRAADPPRHLTGSESHARRSHLSATGRSNHAPQPSKHNRDVGTRRHVRAIVLCPGAVALIRRS